ncbi:hypothetical protein FRC08_006789 [Ceratobasidium sp. 394]|nr:hypothetical protein FRC08_006789 [Ceratobasidium sp. 394]
MINGGRIARLDRPKLLILGGLTLSLASSLMLPFSAHLHDQYWPLVFPAFIIGTTGTAIVFVLTNIAFFRTTPPEYAGTVGAVFNAVGVFYREERSLSDLEAKTLEVEQVEVKEAIALAA